MCIQDIFPENIQGMANQVLLESLEGAEIQPFGSFSAQDGAGCLQMENRGLGGCTLFINIINAKFPTTNLLHTK